MIWPIILVLFSIPLLRQRIRWSSIAAMCLSFTGVVLVSLQGGNADKNPGNTLGIVLALSTSVLWAVYFIFNTRDRRDPLARLLLNFGFGTGYLLLGGLLRNPLPPDSAWAWGTAFYVGIFEMGVTFVLWLLAMQTAPATDRISNLVYIAPFLNLFLVRIILGEQIYRTTVFGIILLVSGILIQNMLKRNASEPR
jgi:drug/metabolite transporter (DMT)-like permease